MASPTTIRSGVITSRIETREASRSRSCISTRLPTSRWTSASDLLVGELDVEEHARERARRGQHRLLLTQDLVQPPAGGVGEGEQPQRLAGRRAVDDDRVVVARLDVVLEHEQAEQLVAAGRDGQLLGGDPVHAALHQQPAEPLRDRAPVVLELVLREDLLRVQLAWPPSSARRRPRPAARRPANAPGRWRSRASSGPGQRSAAPWPRPRTSCRPRPCRCRESSVDALPLLYGRFWTSTSPDARSRVPGQVRGASP